MSPEMAWVDVAGGMVVQCLMKKLKNSSREENRTFSRVDANEPTVRAETCASASTGHIAHPDARLPAFT